MVEPAVQAAAIASAIAAGATVSGYLLNQSRARRERKATAFAQALTAIRRYQDFPYKVWRRTSDDAETRNRLGDEQSASAMETQFHLLWLRVDAPVVGEAFQQLWELFGAERRRNYRLAWESPPLTTPVAMSGPSPLGHEVTSPEMLLCIEAMRNELSLVAPMRRRRIRRRIRAQAEIRAVAQP